MIADDVLVNRLAPLFRPFIDTNDAINANDPDSLYLYWFLPIYRHRYLLCLDTCKHLNGRNQ